MAADAQRDRGVTEFAGVAILVAVTVLATASVGIYVLAVDEDAGGPPQANFSYQYIDGSSVLIITHDRGDTFAAGNLTVRSSRTEAPWEALAGTNETAPIGPGATVQISSNNAYGQAVRGGDNVRIVYDPDQGNETVLSRWTGP